LESGCYLYGSQLVSYMNMSEITIVASNKYCRSLEITRNWMPQLLFVTYIVVNEVFNIGRHYCCSLEITKDY